MVRLLLMLCSAALFLPAIAIADEIDHIGHDHATIQITSRKIYPEVATIGTDDAVSWANLSEHVVVVSFSEDILKSMICKTPTNFVKDGGRFNSAPMRGNEFASVCQFKPGRYEYEIQVVSFTPGATAPRMLKGALQVE